MAELLEQSVAVAVSVPAGAKTRPRSGARAWLGLLPYAAYMALFLVLPVALLTFSAFRRPRADGAMAFSLQNLSDSLHGAYLSGLLNSIQLAGVTALIAAVCGAVLAWAVLTMSNSVVSRAVSTASAVLANFGGLPLAFLFVAALGSTGVLTTALDDTFGLSGFDLYSLTGVQLVYLYFLIPLMVLVITPTLEQLKPQWREAAQVLGASSTDYWRLVALPVLLPQFLGAAMLLFCSAFSAFATASALTNGTLVITPLQIDSAVSGNVLTGQENLGAALALNMIVVVVPLTLGYQFLQARTSRWLR